MHKRIIPRHQALKLRSFLSAAFTQRERLSARAAAPICMNLALCCRSSLRCRPVVSSSRSFSFRPAICSQSRSLAQLAHATQSKEPFPLAPARHSIMDASFANFDLVKRVKLSSTDVVVSKWRSRVTGLSVVHLDYDCMSFDSYIEIDTHILTVLIMLSPYRQRLLRRCNRE